MSAEFEVEPNKWVTVFLAIFAQVPILLLAGIWIRMLVGLMGFHYTSAIMR